MRVHFTEKMTLLSTTSLNEAIVIGPKPKPIKVTRRKNPHFDPDFRRGDGHKPDDWYVVRVGNRKFGLSVSSLEFRAQQGQCKIID